MTNCCQPKPNQTNHALSTCTMQDSHHYCNHDNTCEWLCSTGTGAAAQPTGTGSASADQCDELDCPAAIKCKNGKVGIECQNTLSHMSRPFDHYSCECRAHAGMTDGKFSCIPWDSASKTDGSGNSMCTCGPCAAHVGGKSQGWTEHCEPNIVCTDKFQ